MNNINFMQVLSSKEVEKMNRDLLLWVKKGLKNREYGVDLYNLINNLKSFIEKYPVSITEE